MDKTFKLEIKLGNDAMRTSTHVANTLAKLAEKIRRDSSEILGGKIMDVNGNSVGTYDLESK